MKLLASITKAEAVLLGMATVFLCAVLAMGFSQRQEVQALPVFVSAEAEQTERAPERTVVDINTADEQALTALPGIGEELSRRIVAYRQEHGAFESVDELKNVSGIGEKKLEQLRAWIQVGEEGAAE